ncbi:MAG: hypothetical protein KatS3mg010_0947 [Acidimicrobiia bacterium]|nr:MAG: hypothetical protein KatS3mg010_0947 [Acidimicrobiia bacterium]
MADRSAHRHGAAVALIPGEGCAETKTVGREVLAQVDAGIGVAEELVDEIGQIVRVDLAGPPGTGLWVARVIDRTESTLGLLGDSPPPASPSPHARLRVIVEKGPHCRSVDALLLAHATRFLRVRVVGPVEELHNRKAFRVDVALATTLSTTGEAGDEVTVPARVLNLSVGGARITTAIAIEQGAQVAFTLALGGVEHRFRAVVVRAIIGELGTEIGVRFDRLPNATEAALLRYLFQLQRALLNPKPGPADR